MISRSSKYSDRPPDFEDWRGQCRGKSRFTSKRQANGARRVMVRDGVVNHPPSFHAYKCSNCRYWHLGTDFYKAVRLAAKLTDSGLTYN